MTRDTARPARRSRPGLVAAAAAVVALGACSATQAPQNDPSVAEGAAYQAQYRAATEVVVDDRLREAQDRRYRLASATLNAARCTAPAALAPASASFGAVEEILSAGDLLRLEVGEDGTFSGDFEVASDGRLKPPYITPIAAAGRATDAVQRALTERLVAEGYYPAPGPRISLRLVSRGPARVHVGGAVFEPGAVSVGGVGRDDRDAAREAASGAGDARRSLAEALRNAGGIRPDADLSRVRITRGGVVREVDLTGALAGRAFDDPTLIAGDTIEVPSRGCFQEALMAPSAVTPPGVKVFMSNLTRPADANALSAVGKDARELRYGARFTQAVVGMNCVGGAKLTNADRTAVLFTRDPATGESIVIERRIEDLIRRADRDELDPFILPGDALACYDSDVIDLVEVAKAVGVAAVIPALLGL
ncbi:polysaccharide biosynthesis/export family protein [uncultured Albimonas sp.]|uniref:polysaccharide biosynthesis/export family protein n=1 Tax=uncultured Albimonas sp. TaxID=1331701 RepID=UPI0030EEE81D|tara:strand:+ start:6149 stop:7411 length:1263 start_codon:yes stop_codon:yes gene_type:complete